MSSLASGSVVRQIGSLFEGSSVAGMSDRQLLDRFTAQRDAAGEAAFTALVLRHGPMVLGVCTELLGNRHHAEDAFQAVFLVLAQKAHSVRDPDLLGNWLYGVALRTSRCARIRLGRRRKHEAGGGRLNTISGVAAPSAEQSFLAREQIEALHEEIERLPRAFRLPMVLCYLEGLTVLEAARRLGCSHGTVRCRMARARDKLRRGLVRRGVGLPAAVFTAALSSRSARASVSPHLAETTSRAAIQYAAGRAAASVAAVLAQEVLRSMLTNKVRLIALSLLLTAGASAVCYLTPARAGNQEPKGAPLDGKSLASAQPNTRIPPAGRMLVVGRVLDPNGKEIAGVPIEIIGRPREPFLPTAVDGEHHRLLGSGVSTAGGRFSLEASRTSFTRFFKVYALAAAPGFGLGWAELNANAGEPTVEIRLQPEQIIRGKLFDVNGQPAARVELQIWSVGRQTSIGTFDGVNLANAQRSDGIRDWPAPVTTDDQGRFTLAGIGRGVTVGVNVRDDRFASQGFRIKTDDMGVPNEFTQTLQPATVIEGRVLAADTGQPIANAVIALSSGVRVRADKDGHYTGNVPPAMGYQVEAFPPEGEAYLAISQEFACPKGTVKLTKDINLPCGVLIHGKVIEQGSGRPVAGASVQFMAPRPKPGLVQGYRAVVVTRDDGSYQIVVPPGNGHLFVYGPTSDYVLALIGERMLYEGKPGGERYYAHDVIPYEVKAGESPNQIKSELRPGKIVKGRLVGPGGQTVDKAEIVALLHFNYFHLNWRGDLTIHARDGIFELHGLDPGKLSRVSFLDADHEWGATVELSGKQSGEDMTIQLEPCGQATARFLTPDGKPIARMAPHFEILGSTGPSSQTRNAEAQQQLAADAAAIVNLDRRHYWNGRLTDADGRITLPCLIPGATYRISDWSTVNDENKGVQVRKDFSVKPGETLDLGDIVIEKPAR